MPELELTVSEFVAIFNQTIELAYPNVAITGELANFRVSKNRWVYFDLKDEDSTLKFFGTVYQLPGPLEDGMLLKVVGMPRLHNLYGFSITIQNIQPAGEGSIRRAADLLQAKLAQEGLFDEARKRYLPYPPATIGLITSKQSAAYADFMKIINARWSGLMITLVDVQVQGEMAPAQIISAIEQFNAEAEPPEILVIIRGGGSAEDLAAFSSEQVTRAVAASRVPTLVAVGHETDVSLAELAADARASTPSNAAELLVPELKQVIKELETVARHINHMAGLRLETADNYLNQQFNNLEQVVARAVIRARDHLSTQSSLLAAFNPAAVLKRGYAIVKDSRGQTIRRVSQVESGDSVTVQLGHGGFDAKVE